MKRLFLLRHAQAAKKADESDFERPITTYGLVEAGRAGKFLLKNSWMPDLVISSSSVRTLATYNKMFETISPNKPEFESTKKLYNASATEILEVVKKVKPEVGSLMLIGHNPGITSIVNEFNMLSCDPIFHANAMNYDITCKLVVLEFGAVKWSNIGNEKCTLVCVYSILGTYFKGEV